MRRRSVAPIVVGLGALVLVAWPGSGGAITFVAPNATNVRTWLGTWRTNFGTLYFDSVSHVKSDVAGPNGESQYAWVLKGSWDGPGKTVEVSGAIAHKDYETYGGCWKIPEGENRTNCAPILIYRTNHKITGGYWKACPIATICTDHHPFRGLRQEGAWLVGYRFTQHGLPDGQRVIRTQTGGAGTIVYSTNMTRRPRRGRRSATPESFTSTRSQDLPTCT